MMSFDISGISTISSAGLTTFLGLTLSDLAARNLGELFRRSCSSVFHQDNSDRFLFFGTWNVSLSISDSIDWNHQNRTFIRKWQQRIASNDSWFFFCDNPEQSRVKKFFFNEKAPLYRPILFLLLLVLLRNLFLFKCLLCHPLETKKVTAYFWALLKTFYLNHRLLAANIFWDAAIPYVIVPFKICNTASESSFGYLNRNLNHLIKIQNITRKIENFLMKVRSFESYSIELWFIWIIN